MNEGVELDLPLRQFQTDTRETPTLLAISDKLSPCSSSSSSKIDFAAIGATR